MRKRVSILVGLLLLAIGAPLFAQAPPMMTIEVQPDRILIGTPDFVPRFLDLPRVLVVAAGQEFVPAADSTFDYIEVKGTLKCSRSYDTALRFTHLFILPGGRLDCGTVADPIPATRRVVFIIRDVPIDTARDPFQWGNGLLNFGTQSRVGASKLAFTSTTGDIPAGTTSLILTEPPVGWRVGDELLLPDTRASNSVNARPRREATVTIAGISGSAITLSKPTDFAHLAQREPDGTIVLQPRVANLTRNIVIRSENPNGTPGHTADVGHMAMWDVRNNENVGLGRTKGIQLDRTTVAGHIGTNQVGRYADHHHHAMGFGSSSVGNVLRGRGPGGGKWGMAVHGTHDARIEDNIAIDFTGSGFITEDGYETRNAFVHNFAAYIIGNHDGGEGTKLNITLDNPGPEGSGFWLRGVQQALARNEVWDCAAGIIFIQFGQVIADFPSVPGGVPDTHFNVGTALPTSFTDNVTASNLFIGLEYWFIAKFPAVNHVSAYNGAAQLFLGISGPAQIYLINPTLVGFEGQTFGIDSGIAYNDSLEIDGGGHIVGNYIGVAHGGANRLVRLSGTASAPLVLQNVVNISMPAVPRNTIFENVQHVILPGFAPQFIEFGTGTVWSGTGRFPPAMAMLPPSNGSQHVIKNWQGSGRDFRLFTKQQVGNTPAWPSDQFMFFGVPEAGLTMQQAWDKYGLSYGGETVNAADLVPLEGLIYGVAREGLSLTLPPPRGVVTFPTERASAPIEPGADRFTWVYAALTGDPTGTGPMLRVSIDGGAPFLVGPPLREDWVTVRTFVTRNLTEGTHEIKTWRTDPDQAPISASAMTFHYVVGAVVTPQPTLCTDPNATNVGGPLPCVFPPPVVTPPALCQDPKATNVGGPLPCVFPPPVVTPPPPTRVIIQLVPVELPDGSWQFCKNVNLQNEVCRAF